MTAVSSVVVRPFFADVANSRRFAISTSRENDSIGSILLLPPFAEEMNKCRRMAALTAHALAVSGWHVLRPDLYGCGDSQGRFCDATWSIWLKDVTHWIEYLKSQSGGLVILWGIRAGALLAAEWLDKNNGSLPLLLWHPVTNGHQYLTQFLRLSSIADMLDSKHSGGRVTRLKQQLANGLSVHVAGYLLNPALANPLSQARLELTDTYDGKTRLLEILQNPGISPSPSLSKLADTWHDNGLDVSLTRVVGPAFWRTIEIETIPELISATVHAARELAA